MPYIGKDPGTGLRGRFIYTATAGQTSFTGADSLGRTLTYTDSEYTDVYLNGVKLDKTDYTATSGTSIVLDSGASAGDILEVLSFDTFGLFSGEFAQDVTVAGDLTVSGTTTTAATTMTGDLSLADKIVHTGDTNTAIRFPAADTVTIETAASERLRIDSSGNVGINETSLSVPLEVKGAQAFASSASNLETSTTKAAARIRGANDASTSLFFGTLTNDAEQYIQSANGAGSAADDISLNPFGGRFFFGKTQSGNAIGGVEMQSVTSTSSSLWVVKNTTGSACIYTNRTSSAGDGSLVFFASDENLEGSISVSGTTVSYNGGHLSRWSQFTDGTKDTSIIKGTVMTNLDKMAVWSHDAVKAKDAILDDDGNIVTEAVEAKDAYTEDNEQLNCMAVSSVEGDPNVAGVFVNWDNDDDGFNDMNVAMTGDMVIRIAQGTTVARGDLLMSAGDGTAKPQGDDIVRSKTIAKVTSTQVSHTYDDGTYLVPCVLMAC